LDFLRLFRTFHDRKRLGKSPFHNQNKEQDSKPQTATTIEGLKKKSHISQQEHIPWQAVTKRNQIAFHKRRKWFSCTP